MRNTAIILLAGFVALVFQPSAMAGDNVSDASLPGVQGAIEGAAKAGEGIAAGMERGKKAGHDPVKNVHEEEQRQEAGKLDAYTRSSEFSQRVKAARNGILDKTLPNAIGGLGEKTVPLDKLREFYAGLGSKSSTDALAGRLGKDERVYIFVSSSVPMTTVRNYMIDAAGLRDPRVMVVMQGFVGGIANVAKPGGPHMQFIKDAAFTDPSCVAECKQYNANIIVMPSFFQKYGISEVPAFVYARGVSMLEGFEPESGSTEPDAWLVTGDVSLAGALLRINEDAKSPTLAAMADKLRSALKSPE